jgi:hypothetical protein
MKNSCVAETLVRERKAKQDSEQESGTSSGQKRLCTITPKPQGIVVQVPGFLCSRIELGLG